MRDENAQRSKLSWSKTLVKKWFNIKNKAQDFHADQDVFSRGEEKWRSGFSERDGAKKSRTERPRRGKFEVDPGHTTDLHDYRIFVASWNVGGKSPPAHLNLEDWLHTSPPADLYVLGFQEIVPLNAGNVLGTEDNGPAKKWLSLIRRTLNNLPPTDYQTPSPIPDPIAELHADFETSSRRPSFSLFPRRSFHSLSRSQRFDGNAMAPAPRLDRRFSVCDRVMLGSSLFSDEEDNVAAEDSPAGFFFSPAQDFPTVVVEQRERLNLGEQRYCLVASKQMVGIFLTVWIRREIKDDVKKMKVSCVGRGLMGYLGNKGSISISMSLHRTSFCFVCTHLSSGEKDGDELRRNSDVLEILRKTRFPPVNGQDRATSPETILDHDRVIWLGDLNYRIALSYRTAKALVEMRNWKVLLENDQLRIEQRSGRVFVGWNEGRIYFPPTYKYSTNSDRYAGYDLHPKEKRRTPAWCDRILWYGRGLTQISYVRGESRFSDHRPVYSVFSAEVEKIRHVRSRKHATSFSNSSRVEVEELLPHYPPLTELAFF